MRRPQLRWFVTWFLALNVVAVAAVTVAATMWSIRTAKDESLRFATATAQHVAEGLVAPLLTPELRTGDRAALDNLDRAVRNRMRDGSIVRVKVWDPTGRIVYSDVDALIGRSYPLSDEDRELLGTRRAVAEVSDLTLSENTFEQVPGGRLVETYVGITDTSGAPLLFEAYFPADRLDATTAMLTRRAVPAALLTILALQLLQLPLALTMARRLDHAHQEHGRLLEHAITASDRERRRIARDLHDGVIQDLAGVGYTLDSVAEQLPDSSAAALDLIRRAASIVQRDVKALRRTMVELYPPDLSPRTLPAALNTLLQPLRERGVTCELKADGVAGLDQLTTQALYRAAHELVRNVDRHAGASRAKVSLDVRDDTAVLTVVDDGRGVGADPDPGEAPTAVATLPGGPPGHLGLRLLREAMRDAGGDVTLAPTPGGGCTATATVVVR